MNDWILLLILAVFGIIGYQLMGLVDRSISRHTADRENPDREKKTNEHAETGESKRAYPGMSFFFNIQR